MLTLYKKLYVYWKKCLCLQRYYFWNYIVCLINITSACNMPIGWQVICVYLNIVMVLLKCVYIYIYVSGSMAKLGAEKKIWDKCLTTCEFNIFWMRAHTDRLS